MKTIKLSILTTMMLAFPTIVFAADSAPKPEGVGQDICNFSITKEEYNKIKKGYYNHYYYGNALPEEQQTAIQALNAKYPKQSDYANRQKEFQAWKSSYGEGAQAVAEMVKKFEEAIKTLEERRKSLCQAKQQISQQLGIFDKTFDSSRVEGQGAAVDAKKHCEYYKNTQKLYANGLSAYQNYKNTLGKVHYQNIKMLNDLNNQDQKIINGVFLANKNILARNVYCRSCNYLKEDASNTWTKEKGNLYALNDKIFGSEFPRIEAKQADLDKNRSKLDAVLNRCGAAASEGKESALSAKEWAALDEQQAKNNLAPETVDSATAKKYKKFYEESSIGNAVKAATSNKNDGVRLQNAVNNAYKEIYGADYQHSGASLPYLRQDGIVGKRTMSAVNSLYTNPKTKEIFVKNLVAQGFSIDTARALASDPN